MVLYKQALFLYHVKEREYKINEMMAHCLRETGLVEEIIIEEFYTVCRNMYMYKPDLVVTIPPRDDISSAFLSILKLVYDSQVISVSTEGVEKIDYDKLEVLTGFNRYPAKLIDYYFFWGPTFAKAMANILYDQNKLCVDEQIKVFGYLPYEKETAKKYWNHTTAHERIDEKKKKYQKCVMVVTGFQGADNSLEEMQEESALRDNSLSEINRIKRKLEVNKLYKSDYFRCIIGAIEQCKNTLFIIKLHPVELDNERVVNEYLELEKYDNVFIIRNMEPIASYFSDISLLVHYGSTTGLEAYIYKIPTIQLDCMEEYSQDSSYGGSFFESTEHIVVNDVEKFVRKIRESIKFTVLDNTERALFDYMNYSSSEDYRPSSLLKKIFCESTKHMSLTISDSLVKNRVFSKNAILLKLSLAKRMVECFLQGNIEESRAIGKWFAAYLKKMIG